MTQRLSQSTLDAIWGMVADNPKATNVEIARIVGCSQYAVWNVRTHVITESRQRRYTHQDKLQPRIKPKHIKAEQFSDDWWKENDAAFRAAMLEAAE